MLTGNLVRVRVSQGRVIPLYLNRDEPGWLDAAEELLIIFRKSEGRTRGEIQAEIDEIFGESASLIHRGLAKVLEDRSEFEVVADIEPATLRKRVFDASAEYRRALAQSGRRAHFEADAVLAMLSEEMEIEPDQILAGLFADLRDENRLIQFRDLTAQRLVDRYNLALAQAVLLRAVRIGFEVRGERPARYRRLFHQLKFHRLFSQVEGSMDQGYRFELDGPLSLFSATQKYGLQMALFLPALLLCRDYRLDAELRWGAKRDVRRFLLDSKVGLVSHYQDRDSFVAPELKAMVERFGQVAPDWSIEETTKIIPLGREGVWVPDFRIVHRTSGLDVFLEVLGFWRKSSLERLLNQLPQYGPPRYILAVSESFKVDQETLADFEGPVLRFREIPNAKELLAKVREFLGENPESTQSQFLSFDPQDLK